MYQNISVIAEVKTESPYGYAARNEWDELFELAERIGDIVSVHTDPRWGGSFELVRKARNLTSKPILAKGIHKDDSEIEKALEAGADYVLVVGRIPGVHVEACMIEPLTLAQLASLPQGTRAVWNSRDLETGGLKKEGFEEARRIWGGWLCQASNISSVADIKEGADAVLVGERLEAFAGSLEKYLRERGEEV
jgi:indole-3-glycerol phosphate synthase